MSGLRTRLLVSSKLSWPPCYSAVETTFLKQHHRRLSFWRGTFGVSSNVNASSSLGFNRLKRQFHVGVFPACARFKLNLERNKSAAVEKEEKPEEEDDGGEGYMKRHPYRQFAKLWKSKSELAKTLIDNVIHNDHGLFVTNKPFGVGVRQPTARQRNMNNDDCRLHLRGLQSCPYTLEEILPELQHLLGKPKLVLVRSTEKHTSGIAVFADDEETGARFSKCVASSKVYFDTLYKYHVITVLPPQLHQDPNKVERLGVAIKKNPGTDIGQPTILREYSINSVKRRDVVAVHCKPKLLQVGGAAYLVELNTSSIAYNFLRIYCVDKLAPILGDHLYSSRVQTLKGIPVKIDSAHLTPGSGFQKLSEQIREGLQLLQPQDSLFVPTHAHLRSYKVRKFLDRNNKDVTMEFEAPYPPYFKWTCEQLGIVLGVDIMPNYEN